MTSNPKNPVTIVLPERRGPIIMRPARVFVGDVELPAKSVDVDLQNGDVDLTLSIHEVRIVREAPAPVEPENTPNPEPAKPGPRNFGFRADPDSIIVECETDDIFPTKYTITFREAPPSVRDDFVVVRVGLPDPTPATSPTGRGRYDDDLRGAR